MLDIYFIEEDGFMLEIPEDPDENKKLGSMDLDQHKRLESLFERCELKGARFPYFEDSLLTFEQIRTMNKVFDDGFDASETVDQKTLEAYEKFKKILSVAICKKTGLVSFCD